MQDRVISVLRQRLGQTLVRKERPVVVAIERQAWTLARPHHKFFGGFLHRYSNTPYVEIFPLCCATYLESNLQPLRQ